MMTTSGVRRRAISYITAGGLAIAGGLVLANAEAAQAQIMQNGDKVWVCKYVGRPGVDERLQRGGNPVEVGWRAADKDNDGQVSVGDEFADSQGRSKVIQINGPDPGIGACPPAVGPSTTAATTPATTTSAPASTSRTTSSSPTNAAPRASSTKPPRRSSSAPAGNTSSTTPAANASATTRAATPATMPAANASGTTPPTNTTSSTTTSSTTTSATPATGSSATTGGPGSGPTPGPNAPETGGAGDVNPANGLVGSGLLLAAAGVLANETLRRRGTVKA